MPLDQLPEPLQPYLDACSKLSEHYPLAKGGVRGWLLDAFGRLDEMAYETSSRLSPMEGWTLLTALAALGHTFRWDTVPPRPERLAERSVELPDGIGRLWTALAARLGQPRVGTMWSLHLCNWRLADRPGGSQYRPSELTLEGLRIAHQWLDSPASRHLERFSLSFVMMEAKGAAAVAAVVNAIEAAARSDVQEAAYRLDVLQEAIHETSKTFAMIIRDSLVSPKMWLELVQPTFAWAAADEGGQILSGPNGMQMPTIHCLDAALGIEANSLLAKQSLANRTYMPEPHRQFLAVMDETAGLIRSFVEEAGSLILRRRYNDCLRGLRRFRIAHRVRGSRYLEAGRYGSSGRVSTGMGIEWRPPGGAEAGPGETAPQRAEQAPEDPVAEFERRMTERISETESALLPGDQRADDPTIGNTFRFLSPEERAALIESAPRRTFQKGDPIIRQGERRPALYVVLEGFVRVEVREGAHEVALAHLWPGEVFGELSFLCNSEASAWTIAEEDVEARVLDRDHIYAVISRSPAFAMRFYQSLAVQVAGRLLDINAMVLALRPRWSGASPPTDAKAG